MKLAIIYSNYTNTLSYNDDWLDAFLKFSDASLNIKAFNSLELGTIESLKILYEYDYVIFLHSTNSNGFYLPILYRVGALKLRKAKVAIFIGNEYKLMREKIKFIKFNSIDFVLSQLPQHTAEWLYAKTGSKVISLPHALNEKVFKPKSSLHNREIDIGTRSYEYPWYLGDIDRNKILQFLDTIKNNEFYLDISTDPKKRFNRSQWANFLNDCKFTIATEAGSSFLERDDKTRLKVNKYLKNHPEATFDEVYNKFFKNYQGEAISGKCISSRHFDAIGTKTCQILLEGRYNDILKSNEHYIELKKDFSNIDEVMDKIKDDKLRKEITDRAYEYVINNHTHNHRIEYLLKNLES